MRTWNGLAGIAGFLAACSGPVVGWAVNFEALLPDTAAMQVVVVDEDGLSPGITSVLIPPTPRGVYESDSPGLIGRDRPDTTTPARRGPPARGTRGDASLREIFRGGVGRWAFEVDAVMLWQGNIPGRPMLADNVGQTLLDVNQADTPTSAGPRYRVAFDVDQRHAIEGIFFTAEDFSGEVHNPGGNPVNLPITGALQPAVLLTAARFQSAELNWRRSNGGVITWLMGFRWVEWTQALGFADSSTAATQGVVGIAGNDLYGSQIGMDTLLWNAGPRFRLNGVAKAGIFGNRAYFRADGIPAGGPAAADGKEVSFFGEAGLMADVGITSRLTWRTGYSAYWLSGVALPAENFSSGTFAGGAAPINTGESVLVHGVTTGLEARW